MMRFKTCNAKHLTVLNVFAWILMVPPGQGQASEPLSSHVFRENVIREGGRVDFVFGDDREFEQCHASTIVQAANGRLVCAWFGGKKEKDPDVSVWMSSFDSTTWTAPVRTAKVAETAHWNPVLFRGADNTIHHFFKVGVDEVHWRTYWAQSRDNGKTWSEPTELVKGDVGGRGPVKNKPILLSDGSWLAPASLESKTGEMEIWRAFADRSVDRGKTWTRSADFVVPTLKDGEQDPRFRGVGAIQPTFWESEPGNVHALVRTGSGKVWRTDSTDGGLTWHPYQVTDLPNNNSGLDALRLSDGRVVLVYNPVGRDWGPRTPLDIAVSSDNGATWTRLAHLEDDPDEESEYSYPAIVKTRHGIAVCYTWNRERIRCWQIPISLLATK
jgi:predicted neuraminidase